MEVGIELILFGGVNECDFILFLVAVFYGYDVVLRFLLDRGCDVNFRTFTFGLILLMVVVLNGYMKIV